MNPASTLAAHALEVRLRIRIVQKPSMPCIDGVRLDVFEPGLTYEVGNLLAAVFLAEAWAEPVAAAEPAVPVPDAPRNLIHEDIPPYLDLPFPLNRRRRRRTASAAERF